MTNPTKLITNLKSILEKDEDVLALVLVGSQARKEVYSADKYSDLEAYIVVKNPRFEKKLPEIAGLLGKVLFSFKHDIGFAAVYDDLFRLELPVIKESDMPSVFTRPQAQIVKVLLDKTNGKLVAILNKRPVTCDYEELFKNIVINFWYWQIIGVQYFKRGEFYNARAILNIHASSLIKLFELLNDPKILLLESNKRVEKILTEEQQKLLKEIAVGYDKNELKKALIKVMATFTETAKQIKNKYGYFYDENIEKRIKPEILELLVASN
jgi:hypothetical protein